MLGRQHIKAFQYRSMSSNRYRYQKISLIPIGVIFRYPIRYYEFSGAVRGLPGTLNVTKSLNELSELRITSLCGTGMPSVVDILQCIINGLAAGPRVIKHFL